MPYVCIIGGPSPTFHGSVHVTAAKLSPTIMEWYAMWGGGLPTIRHNQISDLTASLLTEICSIVAIETHLQPLSSKTFRLASTNMDDGTRLDVCAKGYWNFHQDTFLDVRVFLPNAPSNCSRSLPPMYIQKRTKMKRKEHTYGKRVREIKPGIFTPLVLSTSGGKGKEIQTYYNLTNYTYIPNKRAKQSR